MKNYGDFKDTCPEYDVKQLPTLLYKHVSMFGDKTLIFWIKTGRLSVRQGHVIPNPYKR